MSFSTETYVSGSTISYYTNAFCGCIFSEQNGYIFQDENTGSNRPDCLKYNIATDVATVLYAQGSGFSFWAGNQQSSVNFVDFGYMVSSAASSASTAVKCAFATDTISSLSGVNQTNGGIGAGHIQY